MAKKTTKKKVAKKTSSKKQPVGTNKFTSKTLDLTNKEHPWLSNYEKSILAKGGYFDEEGVLHNDSGCIRCTSVVKSTGQRCKNFAVPGELSCHIHGGTLARAKQGKQRMYSAFIEDPTLLTIFENACNDDNKEVSGIREELGLLRMLLAKVLHDNMPDTAKEVKEVASVIGEIRQLVDACTKAEVRLGQLIDISKIVGIMQQAAQIIMKYVKDPETIELIARDFDNILVATTGATTPQLEPVQCVGKVQSLPTEVR